MKKDFLKQTVVKLGKIYKDNDFQKLESYMLDLENYLLQQNPNSRKKEIEMICDQLLENRVLEIARENIEFCQSTIFISDLSKLINVYIIEKTEKIDESKLVVLNELSSNIKVMLIKGMAISPFYPKMYRRNYGDIDILVPTINDVWTSLEILKEDYYFEKLKLHFSNKNKFTSTIDLIPMKKEIPFIDIHLTPYYMWGAVFYFNDIWERAIQRGKFFVPKVEDIILMLCAHISNQWMYRMRDINDLYCLVNSNEIDWNWVITKSKEKGLDSILKILINDLTEIYGDVNIPNVIIHKIKINEVMFRKYNFGKESIKGSVLIEVKFLYKNYKETYPFFSMIYHCLKNSFYMITTHNRAFSISNKLKTRKNNEVYVLKKIDYSPKIITKQEITKGLLICNINTENEFFKTDYGNWIQVTYKS